MKLNVRGASVKRTITLSVLVVALAAGAAYAILQSRAVVSDNTITTGSANLLISADGQTYLNSVPGFSFDGLVPGGWPAPTNGYAVLLWNVGTTPLDLRLALDDAPDNPAAADLNQFDVTLDEMDGSSPQSFTLGSLLNDGQAISGDELVPGGKRQFIIRADAAEGAKQGVMISHINLAFVGTPHDPNAPSQ